MKKGFTLVELLIVIAVIAILAAVAYVAIDPATRIADANDAQRWSDCSATLEAIMEYIVDNEGDFPNEANWTAGSYYVLGTDADDTCDDSCSDGSIVIDEEDCLDLSDLSEHIAAIPYDPKTGDDGNTDYYITRSAGGIVTLGACDPENADSISVSR